MANPTTNYGFVLPTPTDLVTDLPADFEVALQGVDTQMKTNADAATNNGIQKSLLTTTGDTIYASGASTPARLGIGSTGQVLTVSGGVPTWATSASGSLTLLATTTLSGTSTVVSSISQSYKKLYIVGSGITFSASARLFVNPNSSAGNLEGSGTWNTGTATFATHISPYGSNDLASNSSNGFVCTIDNYTSTNRKPVHYYGSTAQGSNSSNIGGSWIPASAITSLQYTTSGGTATMGGTILLYGVN
jgi:hypothetical protein